MKKLVSSISAFGVGALALVGLCSDCNASVNPSIQGVKENSPLYLDKAIASQDINKRSILIAEHYSHSSHYAHSSHSSHYSHYSSRY